MKSRFAAGATSSWLCAFVRNKKMRSAEGHDRPWTLKQVQGDDKSEVAFDQRRLQEEPIWAVLPQHRHLLPKVRPLIDKLRENCQGRCSGVGRRNEIWC